MYIPLTSFLKYKHFPEYVGMGHKNLPFIDGHQWNGQAGKEHCDQQEEFATPYITKGSDKRCAEKREDALDTHHQTVH